MLQPDQLRLVKGLNKGLTKGREEFVDQELSHRIVKTLFMHMAILSIYDSHHFVLADLVIREAFVVGDSIPCSGMVFFGCGRFLFGFFSSPGT